MSAACIAYENLADGATVAASTQELLLPAVNLQNPHVARKWRSLLSTASVVFTLAEAAEIDTVAMFGISAETIRVRLSATDPSGVMGEVYDSGTQAVDETFSSFVVLMAAPASALYVLVDLATTSEDFVEAGRAFIGTRHQFGVNHEFNWSRGRVDRSVRAKSRGGQTQVSPDDGFRQVQVTFGFLTAAEASGLVDTIDRVNGLHTDVLLILDPDSVNLPRDSYWGLIAEDADVINPKSGVFSKTYKIEARL
jgi:hypothetical protein